MSDSTLRITVVVPCYNYGHLLGETLTNLLSQSFTNWECVIVDDGSKDNTKAIADEFAKRDSRFRYIFQENAGLSAARNTGIKHAKAEFIQLLDADDLLSSGKFSRQLTIFDSKPNLDVVYSEVRYFYSEKPEELHFTMEGENKPWMNGNDSSNQQALKESLIKINLCAVNGPLIRKSVFDRIGNFNTKLRSVEDWEFWCRCAFQEIRFMFHNDSDSHALVRLHSNSMSRSVKGMMEAASIARLTINNLILEDSQFTNMEFWRKENMNELAFLHKSLFELYKKEGNKQKASTHLFSFSKIKEDYRYFIKERLKLLIS
ncbi:MAG: glycosyltransferase [Bacteroidia bacterium]